jgi:two-component sensor histidine kinase
MRFAPADRSVAAARRFVEGELTGVPTDVQDAVLLMVSELATNALVHAESGFDVTVDRSDRSVLVSVSDDGVGTPTVQSPGASEPHGRGIRIVNRLSDEWGIAPGTGSADHLKTVWFRVFVAPPSHGALPAT